MRRGIPRAWGTHWMNVLWEDIRGITRGTDSLMSDGSDDHKRSSIAIQYQPPLHLFVIRRRTRWPFTRSLRSLRPSDLRKPQVSLLLVFSLTGAETVGLQDDL
jgi:hypothetical protein